MSDSRQQPKVPGHSVSDDRTSANSAPQVEFGTDGSVQVTYMSRAAYDRDQQLLKAAKMGERQGGGEGLTTQWRWAMLTDSQT